MSLQDEGSSLSSRDRVPQLPVHNLGAPPKYEYRPLQSRDSLRILVLFPGKPDDPLSGSLEVVGIDTAGSYEPISYVWKEPGPPNRAYEILIREDGDERLLKLTGGGLFAALVRLRLIDRERRLWADQICIDQNNPNERGQQVSLMNDIYKNASHVLVWLGLDTSGKAKSAFGLVVQIDKRLHDEAERPKFHRQFTQDLESQTDKEWEALNHLKNRDWFYRGWIVQEIGTKAPATIFWGDAEIEWVVLHRVCEELTHYHHLRNKFDLGTADIKFLFERFVEPDPTSYHANRFNFFYELHRARGLKFTDQRDRVFAFLGHFALNPIHCPGLDPSAIKADYKKTVDQVYTDLAKWGLRGSQGDSALIPLAAVQHLTLPSRQVAEAGATPENASLDKISLPSWVPDWRTYQGYILYEPISPHYAHGVSKPKLEIDEDSPVLRIEGLEVDSIEACSRRLVNREFHAKRSQAGAELPIEYLWHEICQKDEFNLCNRYINGQSAFFAFMQTLSNGGVKAAGRERKPYHEIPDSRWLEQAAVYLVRAMGESTAIAPDLLEIANRVETQGHVQEEWSRLANGASKGRVFARTRKGYYVLGPPVIEVGDVICVLFGGKLPFCLRPVGDYYMLVGECLVYGLMKGEAIDMMDQKKLTAKVFDLI